MINKRTHIIIEVHEDHTDLHVGRFMYSEVKGENHEQKARELIPLLLNELDFNLDNEHTEHERRMTLLKKYKKQSSDFLKVVK